MHLNLIQILLTLLFAILASATHNTPHHQHHPIQNQAQAPIASMSKSQSLNIFKKPLALHSTSPMTGYLRNGYCDVPASDFGNHAIAAEVSEEFLTFSAAHGNDLRQVGLKGGCKWCLCASRWREAFEARGREGNSVVPK